MPARSDPRWRVMRPARLRLRRWDDEVVVYDDACGDTHLLDDLAGRVLERLLDGGAAFAELAALAGDAGDAPERRVARVQDVLDRLRRAGIVKPVAK